MAGVATSWAQTDPQAAMAWATTLPPSVRNVVLANAVRVFASQDPQAASAYFATMPNGGYNRSMIISDIAESWANTDPAATLAWVSSAATGQTRDQEMQKVLNQMGQTDPAGAAAYLAQLPDGSMRDFATADSGEDLGRPRHSGGADLGAGIAGHHLDVRNAALSNVLSAWISADPAGSANYVQSLTTDPNYGQMMSKCGRRLGARGSRGGVAWAQSLPAGPGQDKALSGAIGAMAQYDPPGLDLRTEFASRRQPRSNPRQRRGHVEQLRRPAGGHASGQHH